MHNYISGQWTRSAATETVPVLNPATGEELDRTPLSPAAEVEQAARAAARAFPAGGGFRSASGFSICSS